MNPAPCAICHMALAWCLSARISVRIARIPLRETILKHMPLTQKQILEAVERKKNGQGTKEIIAEMKLDISLLGLEMVFSRLRKMGVKVPKKKKKYVLEDLRKAAEKLIGENPIFLPTIFVQPMQDSDEDDFLCWQDAENADNGDIAEYKLVKRMKKRTETILE